MKPLTCLTCNSIVVPKRPLNWLLLIIFNVWYMPFYFLSKKRCPKCKGKAFGPLHLTMTVTTSSTKPARQTNQSPAQSSDAELMMDVMFAVRRIGVQAMESAYIVATSKTVDTVVSRYEFLSELYMGLVAQSTAPSYSLHVQEAIDQFKAVRYNSIPESYQMQLVLDPKSFDLPEFYARALNGVAARATAAQVEAIQSLKKDDAKQRRLGKIKEDIKQCLSELETKCRGASSYGVVHSRLEAAVSALDLGALPTLEA